MKSILSAFCGFFYCALFSLNASIPDEILTQFQGIRLVLEQADNAYYQKHESIMSDDAYDYLRSYHDQLIDEYPELVELEAPLFVSEDTSGRKQKVDHKKPVLSLKKVYSDSEVVLFYEKVAGDYAFEVLLEPKIDGAAIVVEYRNGRLTEALTRGNSLKGVDVTKVLLASGALPLKLAGDFPELLRLRGEAYLSKSDFDRLNQERNSVGERLFSSARNAASGTLMLSDYAEVTHRGLKVLFFNVRNARELGFTSDCESLLMLKALGLPVVSYRKLTTATDLLQALKEERNDRSTLPYDTDGFVIKVDDLRLREKLGATQKYPRWAIARKFRSEPVVTCVLSIEYSESENGRITPIAILDPIEIGGAVVKRASLHSDAVMQALRIEVGSHVKVIRAGGVVPEIVGVVE